MLLVKRYRGLLGTIHPVPQSNSCASAVLRGTVPFPIGSILRGNVQVQARFLVEEDSDKLAGRRAEAP
jgi:hypothetical protein